MVASLLENALTYTPAGGEIAVTANADGRFARLTVTNDDATLTDDDLPRLFERFWRKDQARGDGQHSGLGLAIALAMARAMGGSLAADRPARGRLRLTLALPLAQEGIETPTAAAARWEAG